ncbi:MAG: alpha/beta hydrolase [Burkholderiaceae bacterium]
MTGPFVDITDGHRLYVRDWGAGRPVLLLAGWGLDSRIWGATMAALADAGLRALACDRRGHGRSTDPGRVDYDLLADDLAAVLDTTDLRGLTVVAHSGAAGEVLRYMSRHGAARIERLILVGAAGPKMISTAKDMPGIPASAVEAVIAQLRDDLPAWIEENARAFAPQADARTIDWLAGMVSDASRRILIDFQRVIAEADLIEEARAVTVPVTLIHGDRDASCPIDLTARRYADIIPAAELLVYEDAAHGLMLGHGARLAADIVERMSIGG